MYSQSFCSHQLRLRFAGQVVGVPPALCRYHPPAPCRVLLIALHRYMRNDVYIH